MQGVEFIPINAISDSRGYLFETWSGREFKHDLFTVSGHLVLRGLHIQTPTQQAKLVHVLRGAIHDVVVDLRTDSPEFGQHRTFFLSESNRMQLYIPEGFAHGFLSLHGDTIVHYKLTAPYVKKESLTIRWDDPMLDIQWPIKEPVLSWKDANGIAFREFLNL